jgi:hypothetical protein
MSSSSPWSMLFYYLSITVYLRRTRICRIMGID